MGTIELQDQIEGLQYLSRKYGVIDEQRIGVNGWSYGGYMSLLAFAQRSDIFKVCISGAPVTNWELYDTGYTEKYMSTPQENPEGYQRGSVLNYIEQFPNRSVLLSIALLATPPELKPLLISVFCSENRLLIVHGLIDENVHFKNTEVLVDALIKAQKPYQLQIYPNERHGIRNPSANEHFEILMFHFLKNFL